ncbi:PP-loop ATPase, partial [Cryptosporidium canis]
MVGRTRVVGLISGGKDSIFNLLCCKSLGLEVSALANLQPPENVVEADSYMYQSIGREFIPLIAECMEVPLVRRRILGKAVNQEMTYNATAGDEVEDLFELLKDVKDSYPDIQGVSCGAVMSNYQRNRLEEVCHRLKLQSFCFMWMIPEHALLHSIVESGIKCLIVKVASFGLDGSFLGREVSECVCDFEDIQRNVCSDFHCCGEGGEYESLTIDGPSHLFKRGRISVGGFESICLDSNPYAPVYVLRPVEYGLERKEGLGEDRVEAVLPFLDEEYSLFYYLCDTGRYRLARFGASEGPAGGQGSSEAGLEWPDPDDKDDLFGVHVFETSKTCILAVDSRLGQADIRSYLGIVSEYVQENLASKDWFASSKAISLDVQIRLSDARDAVEMPDLSEMWGAIGTESLGVRWRPTINVSFTRSRAVGSSKIQLVIAKSSRGKEGLIREATCSSISSYGASVPICFSSSLVVSSNVPFNLLGGFQYKSGAVVDTPILLSSCVSGLVPHSRAAPNDVQKRSFLKMVDFGCEEHPHLSLCIELSMSLRSFRCNLSSAIYNSSLLSFENHVDFRFDVFNITHVWIIEISIGEDISLSDVAEYFKSLVDEYNLNPRYGLSKWSSIHKFVKSPEYPSISPIVIPALVDCLPSDTMCKLVPISFILDDYRDYRVKTFNSNSNHWCAELRSFSRGSAAILLFELKTKDIISIESWEEMAKDLGESAKDSLAKFDLSLSEKIICSKFIVVERYYNLVNLSKDPMIRASSITP